MATYPQAAIPATEVRTMKSESANQVFNISIALPPSYPSKLKKKYPTVYLLDANYYFGMVTDLTRIMALGDEFPETIVVGIGYPLEQPLVEYHKQTAVLRTRDLTPLVDKKVEKWREKDLKVDRVHTGGAKRFLQFIKSELVRGIEAEYRADPYARVLAGHSFGGLFVLYALFHKPNLFQGYIAGSPSLWYGDKITFKYESRYAKEHKTLRAKLFLGVGSSEEDAKYQMVSNTIQFTTLMKSRKYRGLSLTSQIGESCDHCAYTAPSFQAGLVSVLT